MLIQVLCQSFDGVFVTVHLACHLLQEELPDHLTLPESFSSLGFVLLSWPFFFLPFSLPALFTFKRKIEVLGNGLQNQPHFPEHWSGSAPPRKFRFFRERRREVSMRQARCPEATLWTDPELTFPGAPRSSPAPGAITSLHPLEFPVAFFLRPYL